MPRLVHTPLALTGEGQVLLNLTQLDLPRSPPALLQAALELRATLFVGMVLTASEQDRLLRDLALLVPNATIPLIAGRHRQLRASRIDPLTRSR